MAIWSPPFVSGEQIFAPDYLWDRHIAEKTDAIDIANTHLGIPYRDDGTLDDRGYFTTFDRPDRLLDTPGMNCSGLVVSVSRFLLNRNWKLDDVMRDRQGNSGAGAPLGKDWDFGWDLVLNLTEGLPRKIIMPDRRNYTLDGADGMSLRGFDLHDSAAWRDVLSQMQPGRMYLGSISKPADIPGYKLLHYHVVLMLPDGKGGVWLYHATRRSQVHRMNIASPQGMERFMSQFRGNRGGAKKILIIEAMLPDLNAPVQTAADEAPSAASKTPEAVREPNRLANDNVPGTSVIPPAEPAPAPPQVAATTKESAPQVPPEAPASVPPGSRQADSDLVINHLSGKVFKAQPEMVTQIPRFADSQKNGLKFWYRNQGQSPKDLEIKLQGPGIREEFKGRIAQSGKDAVVVYPRDFGKNSSAPLRQGRYMASVWVDGEQWVADAFEVSIPREASPKIVEAQVPEFVQSGRTFTVTVVAQNRGAESDYGGLTISTPDQSGLKIVSAKPGRIYPAGSTVLSVTSDRIRTRVPMAERWIELWGENQAYDMQVELRAGRPGTYPLYVRCALRGVNVKSSVILMDPVTSQTVDQQGFPVKVYKITVQ